MSHFPMLSVAALLTALSLSLPASAHDPKAFDRMMGEAEAPKAVVSACAQLAQARHHHGAADDAGMKALQAKCAAEKKAKAASAAGKPASDNK